MSSGPHIGVGAIVVRDDRLLMVQRGKDPGKGLWSLPGGHVEHGEYLVDALKREVLEETNLSVEVGELMGLFEVLDEAHYVILDFLATVVGPTEPTAAADAADARWVPLKQIEHIECTPRFVETLRGWGVLA